jgi:hypothetical protein
MTSMKASASLGNELRPPECTRLATSHNAGSYQILYKLYQRYAVIIVISEPRRMFMRRGAKLLIQQKVFLRYLTFKFVSQTSALSHLDNYWLLLEYTQNLLKSCVASKVNHIL